MRSILYVLPCLVCCIFFQPPSRGEDKGVATPHQKRIQVLRKRIDELRMTNDLSGLRQLIPEAKNKWLADVTKDAAYYPVILDLCLAVKSLVTD